MLFVLADASQLLLEPDETNNLNLVEVTLAPANGPDLAVERFTIDPLSTTAGLPALLSADVSNRGASLASDAAVAFRVNNAEVARVVLSGPFAAGEQRSVGHALNTLTLNGRLLVEVKADPDSTISEQNEANNSKSAYLDVQGSGLSTSVRTDEVSYTSNQDVAITVMSQNENAAARTLVLRVTVQDGAGALHATLNDQAATLSPGTSTFAFTWPTAATPAGPYLVVSELVDNAAVIARGTAAFGIAPDRTASAQLYTDRSDYEPDQTVGLSGRVRNTGVNNSLSNLVARIEVRSPADALVSTSTQTIPLLGPGSEADVNGAWKIANATPGVYTASLELREQVPAAPQLAYAVAQFTVLSSSQTGTGLSGELTVSPSPAGVGTVLLAGFSARNGGNADMPELRLRVRLVSLTDESDALVREFAWPLLRGEQKSGTLGLPTAGLSEGNYQARFEALLPTHTPILASRAVTLVRGVSVSDVQVDEGDAGTAIALFTLVLSSPSTGSVDVDFTTADGTASAGTDYDTAAGTLTFAAGETAKQVSVTIHGDTAPEADEVFLLSLSNVTGAAASDPQALGLILDEEGCTSPNLLLNPSAEEGAVGSDLPGWTVVAGGWTRRLGEPVAIDGGASFTAAAGETLELFQEVDLSSFAGPIDATAVRFAVDGFLRSSGNAATGRVVIEYRDASGENVLDSFDSAELASVDTWRALSDSRPVPAGTRRAVVRLHAVRPGGSGEVYFDRLGLHSLGVPVLSVGASQTAEGDTGTTPLWFRARLSCVDPGGLTVAYVAQADTATAGVDFDAATGSIGFGPAALVQDVGVTVHGDTTDEGDETLRLVATGGSDVVILTRYATGTIVDDDGPVAISIGDVAVVEGDGGTVDAILTLTLSDESGQEARVAYTTAGDSAGAGSDFVATSGTAIFPPGSTEQTVTVRVAGDILDEPSETFFVRLSAPNHTTIADGEGEAVIQDNDEVLIAVGDVRVTEGDTGSTAATFEVALSLPSVTTVSVSYTSADASATAPGDYIASSGTLTFAPGGTALQVTVAVVGELAKEPEETFFVVLSQPTNALLGDPEGVATVVDNDGVLISVADLVVREGATDTSASFVITLSKNYDQPISLDYRTQDGSALAGADYQSAAGVITFPAGTISQRANVTVLADAFEEPQETFGLELSNATQGALILDATAIASVIDGDLWTVNGSASDVTIPGCLLLTPDTWWNAGTAWRNQRIDLTASFDKTFKVFLGNHDGADGIIFTLQNVGTSALGWNGGALGFYPLAPAVGVEIDTHPNPGDPGYDHMTALISGLALSPAVQASAVSEDVEDGREHDLRMVWNADAKQLDAHFDGSERILYSEDLVTQRFGGLSSVIYGFTGGNGIPNLQYFCETEMCIGTASSPRISVGDARVTEADAGTVTAVFPITLSCPTDHVVTARYATANGTAIDGEDYIGVSGVVTFLPGESSKSVAVQAIGENRSEGDEIFLLALDQPAGGDIRYAQGTGTIVSDEVTIAAADAREVEGDLPSILMVPVRLPNAFSTPVSVTYATADGTARAGLDYAAASGSLTFAPGETEKRVRVTLLGDAVAETDESFFLRLSDAVNGEIAISEG